MQNRQQVKINTDPGPDPRKQATRSPAPYRATGALYEAMGALYEFGSAYAQTYEATCECGRKIEVSTQKDGHPEYYADIHVRCVCGKSVAFELPVN